MKMRCGKSDAVPRLVLRPAAEADLANIYHYISERAGAAVAIRYIRRVRDWCNQLLVFPEAGRARGDLRPGVRILTFERRVVIAYAILSSGDVEIGRFFYGGRDYEAIIGSDQY
ncbi:MAG TPA: type II toxin-antitoxin system RelE/ParE family toxin [Stellaceae bacterium]|nr:type II toxin-antitoxin system RelE/ParE family toxin [Stellaceae bacterium]